jgi:hypothetical protein
MQKFETVFNTKITFKVPANLLSDGLSNAKTKKNNVTSFILYLAPANESGIVNVCPFASDGCKSACLYKAGRGKFSNVQISRINRTKFWAADRQLFYTKLGNELLMIAATYKKAAVRLNGTSDIDHLDLLKRYTGIDFLAKKYKNIKFYDYTKNINIVKKYAGTSYHLTFSKSETNDIQVQQALELGANVAAVFSHTLPATYLGYHVVDGDLTDYRPEDGKNVIVGLIAKGPAKKDKSGFVIQN